MALERLKPCPFCGNEHPAVGYDSDMKALGRRECITARCRQCGAATDKFATPQEATVAWNRRTPLPATEPAAHALTIIAEWAEAADREEALNGLLETGRIARRALEQ